MRGSRNEKRSAMPAGRDVVEAELGLVGLVVALAALVQLVLAAAVALAAVGLVALAHGTPPP